MSPLLQLPHTARRPQSLRSCAEESVSTSVRPPCLGQPSPLTSDVIANNVHELSVESTRQVHTHNLVEVFSDNPHELTTDAPPAPTSYLPPTYFLGWLYQKDDFYASFAN